MDKIIENVVKRLESDAIAPFVGLHPKLVLIRKKDESITDKEKSYLATTKSAAKMYDIDLVEVTTDSPFEAAEQIEAFSKNSRTKGILVSSDYGDISRTLYNMIPPSLDINGLSAYSIGACMGSKSRISYRHAPCIAVACMKIIEEVNHGSLDFAGQTALVLGRSLHVGRPLTELLCQHDMTVTLAHSKSWTRYDERPDFGGFDYVVTSIGKANYWNRQTALNMNVPDFIIDVGGSRDEEGNLCGDVDRSEINENYITPVENGVDVVATTVLFAKLFNSAADYFKNSHGIYEGIPSE